MTDTPPPALARAAMEELQRSRCVLLTNYKRDGSSVGTPVWPFSIPDSTGDPSADGPQRLRADETAVGIWASPPEEVRVVDHHRP